MQVIKQDHVISHLVWIYIFKQEPLISTLTVYPQRLCATLSQCVSQCVYGLISTLTVLSVETF